MRHATTFTLALLITLLLTVANSVWAVPVTGGTGPGGLGTTDGTSSLELWFKADTSVFSDTAGTTAAVNADPVGNWNNLSGFTDGPNPYHAIGDVGGREPTLLTGQTPNGGPVLDFVGGAINTGSRLHVTETGTYAMSGNETAFFALDFDQAAHRGILSGNNSPNRAWAGGNGSMFESASFTYAGNYRVDGVDTTTTGAGFHIVTGEDNPTAASNVQLLFGSGHGGNQDYGGRLAEAIVFDEDMNVTQEIIVENYLNAKHNIPLDAGDFYAGDTALQGEYDLDVFGIGNDGSDSVDMSGSEGMGLEATGGTLNSGEFVLAGHKATSNGLTTSDMPDNLQRWERVWYVDTNGGSVDATLGFGWSDSGLVTSYDSLFNTLYYSPTDPYSFTKLASPSSIVGDQVFFDLSSLASGYYTLGSQQVPEPSSLLLLGFSALGLLRHTRRRKMRT